MRRAAFELIAELWRGAVIPSVRRTGQGRKYDLHTRAIPTAIAHFGIDYLADVWPEIVRAL